MDKLTHWSTYLSTHINNYKNLNYNQPIQDLNRTKEQNQQKFN